MGGIWSTREVYISQFLEAWWNQFLWPVIQVEEVWHIPPRTPTLPLKLPRRAMALILYTFIFKNIFLWSIIILLGSITPVIDLTIWFALLFVVLTCTFIKYPIKIMSFIGIWTLNYLIPPNCAKLMGGIQCTKEGDISQCPEAWRNQCLHPVCIGFHPLV